MDFDMSKENIQPLRGGRNRAQLEIALQAQADSESRRELLQNKQEFEHAIRTYEGDDPLDNWYNYISWVEQSYPKHGHEGNLITLLEDCLGKFENDERYIHDRRHCKLWIKYIDFQQNPDELFQLLYSKGICASCSDLYRAWAFYHEIAGDFKRANVIYQFGLQAMAQPYDELVSAQKNMFMAAGRHMIQEEEYEQQMEEQRQALTSLRTYKHKHRSVVPSVRVGHQVLKSKPGSLPVSSKTSNKSNKVVTVFVDENECSSQPSTSSAIKSIIEVAKSQEIKKENTMKPGPWTKLKPKKKNLVSNQHSTPSFQVHEDKSPSTCSTETLHLFPNFCSSNRDNFSDWKTEMYIPEPEMATKIYKFPKKIYCDNEELSLEEIMAEKYLLSKLKNLSVSAPVETVKTNPIYHQNNSSWDLKNDEAIVIGRNTDVAGNFINDEKKSSKQCQKNLNLFYTETGVVANQKESFAIFESETGESSKQVVKENVSKAGQSSKIPFTIFTDENPSSTVNNDQSGSSFQASSEETVVHSKVLKNNFKTNEKFEIFEDEIQEQKNRKHFPSVNDSGKKHAKTSSENPFGLIYKEENTSILSKDVGLPLKSQKKTPDNLKDHVRSLITRQPMNDNSSEIVKLNISQRH